MKNRRFWSARAACALAATQGVLGISVGTAWAAQQQSMKTFASSRTHLTGNLAARYVDFSFQYPANWKFDPTSGVPGASNYAKVSRMLPDNYTQENLAVGSFSASGLSGAAARGVIMSLLKQVDDQFGGKLKNYKIVSQGTSRIGAYKAYETRFQGTAQGGDGPITIWGRSAVVPMPSRPGRGVLIFMLATSKAPELRGSQDIGVKGQMPPILRSFRFGK